MAITKIFVCDNCQGQSTPQPTAAIPQRWFRLQIGVIEHQWKDQKDHFVEDLVLKYFCPDCRGAIGEEFEAMGGKYARL